MREPYRYRVNGLPSPGGLINVWSFEQESKPGNLVVCTEAAEDGSIQVGDKFRVVNINIIQEASDWGIPKSEMLVEFIERAEPERRLLRAPQATQIPFVGCGRKQNPIFILRTAGSLSALRHWTKKCGSERGVDSGQYFICTDCALIYGYRW